MRNGLTVFLDALRAVLSAPGTAVRIVAAPSLVRLALAILAERFLDPEMAGLPTLLLLADAALVAVVAVGWHRYRLLDEAPRRFGPRFAPGRVAGYALRWIGLALGVGLLLMLGWIPLILLEYCCLPAGTLWELFLADEAALLETGWWPLVVGGVIIWFYAWMFSRLAMGLPHFAVRTDIDTREASWAMTARLEPAVLVASALAALGTVILWAPATLAHGLLPETWIYGYIPPEGSYETYRYSVWYLASEQLCFTLQVIFGAAILTELYRDAKAAAEILAG